MSRESLTLILASASPRRREMLSRLGVPVQVKPAMVDERPLPGESPDVHVRRMAREKARTVAELLPHDPVLAADTIVTLDGTILGKPAGRDDARWMLQRLSGRTHKVLTALAVYWRGRSAEHLEEPRVTFVTIAEPLLEWYLATGEGDDKAGAYAVQGRAALFVQRVDGNVQAVVGLPLAPLPRLFAEIGLELHGKGSELTLRPLAL